MNENENIEIRGNVDFTFEDYLSEISLWSLIGAGHNINVLKKIVDAYFNSDRRLKIPRILVCGPEGTGKRTVSHAFINSLTIERFTFIESEFLDSPFGRKRIFENGSDRAVIIGHVEKLNQQNKSILWQYLAFRKCYYHNFKNNDWEIVHYDGILVLTANQKELISKELLKNIDVIVELEHYQPHQIMLILQQKLSYMNICYDEKSFELLLNSFGGKLEKLMHLLKLGIISMMSDGREKLIIKDVEWAIKNYD